MNAPGVAALRKQRDFQISCWFYTKWPRDMGLQVHHTARDVFHPREATGKISRLVRQRREGRAGRRAGAQAAGAQPAGALPSTSPQHPQHWKPVLPPGSGAALRPLPQGTVLSAHPHVTEPRTKEHSYCKNELQQKLLHLSRRKGYIPLLFWYQMAQGLFFNKCCLLYLLTQSPLSYKPNLFP